MSLDRSDVYDLAHKRGWRHIADTPYTDVYRFNLGVEGDDLVKHKYLYVGFTAIDEYNPDETSLVLPHDGEIHSAEDEDVAEIGPLLTWWLDGNEGAATDWWNQLSKEDQDLFNG